MKTDQADLHGYYHHTYSRQTYTNRMKIFINNKKQTYFNPTFASQNSLQ